MDIRGSGASWGLLGFRLLKHFFRIRLLRIIMPPGEFVLVKYRQLLFSKTYACKYTPQDSVNRKA